MLAFDNSELDLDFLTPLAVVMCFFRFILLPDLINLINKEPSVCECDSHLAGLDINDIKVHYL